MLKFFICLCILLNFSNHTISKTPFSKEISQTYASSSSSVYLRNIFLYGDDKIEFFLPADFEFTHIHPFSFVSPSGRQLIHTVPQSININTHHVMVNLRKPLEESGIYQIIFTGIDEITNSQIDLIGNFTYR